MRGGRFFSMLLGATLVAAFPTSVNAQSAEEYADGWTEARRGDRDWMQRATEQLTKGPVERMFGPPADEAMKEISNRVISRVEAMYNQRRDPCLAAAVNLAHSQTLIIGYQEALQGAMEMLFSAAGGAAGGGEIRDFLGQRLWEQVKDKLKEKALEKFKKDMREAMKTGLPVHYESDDNRSPCTTEFRIIWDKAAERYDFLFAGDCACNLVSCGKQGGQMPLRRWTLTGWGTVIPEIEQLANGDKKVTWMIGHVQDEALTADCCVEGDRRFRTDPGDGGGNAWVGFERTPQTAPPQTQPPRRPQTGGTPPATGQTGTTGTTPRPVRPPRPIDIPVIPDRPLTDAELTDLDQRTSDAHDLAQSRRVEADNRLIALQRDPAATPEQIAEAEAALEAARQIHIRARLARDKMNQKLIEADQQQQQQQQEQQSSNVAPLDPVAAGILAVHNKERSAVGVAPLIWDSALAASASAYALKLAAGGPFVHSPRTGRENERENLSRGLPGASAERMMVNWTGEKANFTPGIYPEVSKTGNWYDVSHYTQMIWPTTTRVGCGTAGGMKQAVLVCRYTPPGNRDGSPILAGPGLTRLPVGGGMQRIDPPAPPPPPRPTASDPAPDGNEALHPLATLFAGALNRHNEALRNCDRAAAERALDEMRYAIDELRKRLKDARSVGGFSSVNQDALQRLIDALERVVRGAGQRTYPGTCPPR